MIDVDFVKVGTSEKDIELFLGPTTLEQRKSIKYFGNSDKMILAHLVFHAGIMKSISEARRNGWDKPIPHGYSEFVIGKLKSRITILNIIDNE